VSGETERAPSGWTVDTLAQHFATQHDDMRRMLDERYATQTKAVDAAFLAQQTAMQTALTAAERAVATALLSAEKAVAKAETAADKRFDGVNEFRGQLADQAATLMPRRESEVALASMAEKIDSNARKLSELELRLTSRLDLTSGHTTGMRDGWGYLVGVVGLLGAVVGIVLGLR
jgi:hypothetical protein